VIKPSQRREMALEAVKGKVITIRLAYEDFVVSESSYRYKGKLGHENAAIGILAHIEPFAYKQ